MASRTKQKEEARARRLAEERARAERQRRQNRIRAVGGIVLIAVIVVAVAIAVSSSGGGAGSAPKLGTAAARQAAASVNTELSGIPQSGMTIGKPSAPVTVTEYGDLQCPVCKDFAESGGSQLIAKDVRAGKVKLVYRSLETASQNSPIANIFPTQQAAAVAAGKQNLGWNYVLLFYKLQGQEGTGYATESFLSGLAGLVPGLAYAKWSSDRSSSAATNQVAADEQAARSLGFTSTPSLVVQGPKGQAQPIVGAVGYDALESAIKSVS